MLGGGLCPPGGNWIGEKAKADRSPLETLRREIEEEITFNRPPRSTEELKELGIIAESAVMAPTPGGSQATPEDIVALAHLVEVFRSEPLPFLASVNHVTTEAMRRADPDFKGEGFLTLSCYYLVPLGEKDWQTLDRLQRAYGNLSNESITLTTSLQAIIESGVRVAFAHDEALRRFFLEMGLPQGREIPHLVDTSSDIVGMPPASYEVLLAEYDVLRRPQPATS